MDTEIEIEFVACACKSERYCSTDESNESVCLPLTITAANSLSFELDDGFIDDSRYSMFKAFFSFESR